MPKTTFVLVTVLFGVICGNRLMDNRLLRSSALLSYAVPYKTASDANRYSVNGKIETSRPADVPCVSGLDFDHDLATARHCNDNMINPTNYLPYDNNDDDLVHNTNALISYQNAVELDDALEVEPVMPKRNLRNMKILQPKINTIPIANYKDFYDDLIVETAKDEMAKRNGNSLASAHVSPPPRGCDCKIRNDLVDLGQQHFPRYLLNAVCHTEHSRSDLVPKCWSGSVCRPLEYKVKVLTFRTLLDNTQKDPTLVWLPDDLRQIWKFKTVTVTAGCFCS